MQILRRGAQLPTPEHWQHDHGDSWRGQGECDQGGSEKPKGKTQAWAHNFTWLGGAQKGSLTLAQRGEIAEQLLKSRVTKIFLTNIRGLTFDAIFYLLLHVSPHVVSLAPLGETFAEIVHELQKTFEEKHPSTEEQNFVIDFICKHILKQDGIVVAAEGKGFDANACAPARNKPQRTDWRGNSSRGGYGEVPSPGSAAEQGRQLKRTASDEELEWLTKSTRLAQMQATAMEAEQRAAAAALHGQVVVGSPVDSFPVTPPRQVAGPGTSPDSCSESPVWSICAILAEANTDRVFVKLPASPPHPATDAAQLTFEADAAAAMKAAVASLHSGDVDDHSFDTPPQGAEGMPAFVRRGLCIDPSRRPSAPEALEELSILAKKQP